jgi:hypothetical protein
MPLLRPIAAVVLLGVFFAGARGEDERPDPTARPPGPDAPPSDVTKPQLDAIANGLAWLASAQSKVDGSFNEEPAANIAVTSLAVLAFMANGNTLNRGRYSDSVARGVDFLLRHVTSPTAASPERPAGYIHLDADEQSRMHGHGYATLALALAYGLSEPRPGSDDRSERAEIREKLRLAVSVIERSQDDTGGWWYYPVKLGGTSSHEGSVTVCMIQALRMAREAGIPVRKETIDRAVSYLERSQDPATGGFCYSLTTRDRQTYALTAAALATLFGLGEYGRDRMVAAGFEFMDEHFESNLFGYEGWFFYANLYAAQALWQAAAIQKFERNWRRWWPRMRDHLVNDQRTGGYWPERGAVSSTGTGPVFATSCAVLILSVPLQLLPLFQR